MALLESSHDSKPPGLPAVQPEDENLTIKLPSSQPPPANAQPAVDPEPTATSSPPSVVTPAPATAKRNTTEDGKPRAKKRRAAAAATNYADVQDDELLKPSESLVIKPIEAAQLHPVQAEHRHWNHDHVELHTFDGPVLVKMWTPGKFFGAHVVCLVDNMLLVFDRPASL